MQIVDNHDTLDIFAHALQNCEGPHTVLNWRAERNYALPGRAMG
jgi:hypothetical protein